MKIELNEEQVILIEKKLEELGLNYVPLQDELLDHICCVAEEEMGKGKTFQEANQAIFENFGKDELKELQDQTIFFTHQKSQRMKSFVFAVLTLLLIPSIGLFFSNSNMDITKKGIQPPSPQDMMTMQNLLSEEEEIGMASHIDFHEPPSIKPLDGDFEVKSGFGYRIHPFIKKKRFHSGIDFAAPEGTPVLATADGEVIISKTNKTGYGKHIVILHDEGFKTMYAHLSKLKVKKGEKIKKGDIIGLVGTTGTSIAPHLHYEVVKDGKKVDPEKYFNP